ncbi:intermembrane phospholipid transport protein YdbH family protein [Microbulbifer epialgicus]|uniref:YdbH domain-containing protein n=1 Tax=Microbulbifer epialgicus TaxID=393907 RepID=A0ABV4NY40_9GAMM
MRKLRILIISLTVFLAFLLIGSWWKKDIVASQLVNLFAGEVVIQKLSGLELSFRQVSIRQVQLKSNRGSSLVLDDVNIIYPFHIIYDRDNTQKIELSITRLTRHAGKEPQSVVPAPPQSNPSKESTLSLDGFTRNIVRYMPGKVSVKQILLDNSFEAGPLNITRRDNTITLESPYKTSRLNELHLSLQASLSSAKIGLDTEIYSIPSEILSQAKVNLIKEGEEEWKFNARATVNLEAVTPILDAVQLTTGLATDGLTASGQVVMNASSYIPDNIISFPNYQHILLQFETENLKASIPFKPINSKVEARLSTDSPIEVKLKSLIPFIPGAITGSGTIDASLTGNASHKQSLLDLNFEAASSANVPKLQLQGSIFLAATEPLLNSQLWHKYVPSLSISNPKGKVGFQSAVLLHPLGTPTPGENWIDEFHFIFLPESQFRFDTVLSDLPENAPLHSTGLSQSQVQVEVRKKIKVLGKNSSPKHIKTEIIEGAVTANLQAKESSTVILTQINEIQCQISNLAKCDLEITAKAPKLADKISGVTLANLDSSGKLHIKKDSNTQILQLTQIKATAEEIKGKEFQVKMAKLGIPVINCKIAQLTTDCKSKLWNNTFENLASEYFAFSGDINLSNINLKITQGAIELNSNFVGKDLEIQTPENYSAKASLKGAFSLQGDKIEGNSQLIVGSIKVDSDWQHNMELATGTIHFSIPEVIFDPQHNLRQAIHGLPVDIVSGKLSAKGTASWPQQPQDILRLSLNNIAAVYKDSFATGVEGDVLIKAADGHWVTPKPQSLSIQSIDAGLPLENIHFSLSLDKNQNLILRNLSADFLNGKVTTEALVWNLANEERSSTLYAQDVSLEQLALETESENFKASGRLNLTIPITTGPDGITVKNGHLEALKPGGRLRYYGAFSPQMLADNPQLKLIANALEDYDFRSLEGSMEYPPNGDLQLRLKLVGRSESVDSERDLVINLNLENNIPAMLRSLQASRDLTEALEMRLDQ